MEISLLILQVFIVAFLLLHDWIPLGRLNNFRAKRDADSLARRVYSTLLGALPAAIGLFFSIRSFRQPWPHGLLLYFWITYGVFLLGLLRAWWIPYLFVPEPARAARYRVIFAGTHRFLPVRNGMAPDTLHTLFHLAVLAVLLLLPFR